MGQDTDPRPPSTIEQWFAARLPQRQQPPEGDRSRASTTTAIDTQAINHEEVRPQYDNGSVEIPGCTQDIDAKQLWLRLKGEPLSEGHEWNAKHYRDRILRMGGIDVSQPEPAFEEFWGTDFKRDESLLPIISPGRVTQEYNDLHDKRVKNRDKLSALNWIYGKDMTVAHLVAALSSEALGPIVREVAKFQRVQRRWLLTGEAKGNQDELISTATKPVGEAAGSIESSANVGSQVVKAVPSLSFPQEHDEREARLRAVDRQQQQRQALLDVIAQQQKNQAALLYRIGKHQEEREVALKALADQHSQQKTLLDALSKRLLLLDEFAKQQTDQQVLSESLEKQRQLQESDFKYLKRREAKVGANFTTLDKQQDYLSSSKVPLTRPNPLQYPTLQSGSSGMGQARQWLQRLWRGR